MNLFALRDFARHPPPTSLVVHERALAVFDAYPKAKYHFLVLPRLPSSVGAVGERGVDSLAALLRQERGARDAIMGDIERTAEEVVEMIKDEMGKSEGREWGVLAGFHAVPSMRHMHLHIISDDLVSPTLKTKKHYNSFRPDLGFFVSLREVKGWLQESDERIAERAESLRAKEPLLNTPLTCFKCGETMANMPALKRHLDEEFASEAKGR